MMKKIGFVVLGLVVVGTIVLWAKGRDVREIRTEIAIAVRPEEVWSVLIDIDRWEEWSPIIQESEGQASLGSQLTITMVGEQGKGGKDGPKYQPIVVELSSPSHFRWRAKMMANFVFTNDKIFELERTDSGTRLVHKELFSGLMIPMFWSRVESHVPAMLSSMNEALKRKVERNEGPEDRM